MFRLDGRQRSVSFQTEEHAKKFRDLVDLVGAVKALEVYKINSAPRSVSPGMTVEQWLNRHIDHLTGVTKTTLWDYRSYLRNDIAPALGPIPLAELTTEDVTRWVQVMTDKGNSGKTIANKHGFLASALNAAVRAGHIPTNPASGIRLPRTERPEIVFLSGEEFSQLHDAVTDHWKPMVEFLVASGARFGEVAALRPGDVDRDQATVRISRAFKRTYATGGIELGPPKSKRSVRTIDVPASVLDKLSYSAEWLFVNRDGNPVRIVGFRSRVWYPALDRAKLDPRPRVHDLRHTCASWMIAAGVPLPVISAHLGHESIATTVNVYGHLDRSSSRAAAAAIGATLS